MKPAIEEKLLSYGCLLVLVAVCVCVWLAFVLSWTYVVCAPCLIGGWLLICYTRSCRDHQRHLDALDDAFSSSGLVVPHLKERNSYGFPSFTLTFPTEDALKRAEELGCISAFKRSLQTLYSHTGSSENPFDADRAVWATYIGWQPHIPTC